MTAVIGANDRVLGIFTDGDLRRALESGSDLRGLRVSQLMKPNPRCLGPDELAAEAAELMEQYKISQLLVVDENQHLIGALNMHDLMRAKVI